MNAKIEYETRKAQTEEILRNAPEGSKAVIIAEYEEDNCDSQTDYFATKETRTIVLGFSTHTRNLFSEMRKAAKNHPETAFLADAPKDAEHRENYSMGKGLYLKDAHCYDTGWAISKTWIHGSLVFRGEIIDATGATAPAKVEEEPETEPEAKPEKIVQVKGQKYRVLYERNVDEIENEFPATFKSWKSIGLIKEVTCTKPKGQKSFIIHVWDNGQASVQPLGF